MAANTTYLFRGSNIGSGNNALLYDGQNVPEMLYAIQKKFYGSLNITLDTSYLNINTGGNYKLEYPNAFASIHQSKMYSQYVPLSNPINTLNNNNNTQIISWSNVNYYGYGFNMSNDDLSAKYISNEYPYIAYYSNLLLTYIPAGTSVYSNLDVAYGHPLLQNAISEYYDSSYVTTLYSKQRTNGQFIKLEKTDGYWAVDTDGGIVTFYDSNTRTAIGLSQKQVSRSNPPRISFYRYEGLFGEANILEGQDL